MKIAIFTETFLPKVDGIVTILQITLDYFREHGIEAMVFAAGDRVTSYQDIPVQVMRGVPTLMYPELELALPTQAHYRRLQEFQPDLIHVVNPILSGIAGMYFARRLNVPLLVSFHTNLMEMARFYNYGVFEDFLWFLHRVVYNRADYILATSERTVGELVAHDIAPVGLWRRGVDVNRFHPRFYSEQMRRRLTDGHPDRTILLSAGRLAPEKQVDQICAIMETLKDASVHLAVVGDGPQRSNLERIYADYPVTFTGYMHGDDLSAAFATSDLFVFPSSSIETFGLVAAEALASGTPVIASDVGGMREIIQHGVNGYIFPENDTTQMAHYAKEVVRNPDTRYRLTNNARPSIQNRTWDQIMGELVDVYRGLVAGKIPQSVSHQHVLT